MGSRLASWAIAPALPVLAVGMAAGCGSSGGSTGGSAGSGTQGNSTPCAGLDDVNTSRRVHCQGDDCMVLLCNSTVPACFSRAVAELKTTVLFTTCNQILFPDWFYANDCLAAVPPTPDYDSIGVVCFCGRTSTGFAGAVANYEGDAWNSCDMRAVPAPDWVVNLAAHCATAEADCNAPTCAPNCSGRACGPDTCGGSCGTCSSGTCNTAGQCVVPCTPACTGKKCGPDSCGGTCGNTRNSPPLSCS